jgi:transcription elongation GreA/GreB family factor
VKKQQLVASIVHQLACEMELIATAAKSAHEEATHEDQANKNQFETPGLETSVLAEGQVKVAAELREALDAFKALAVYDFAEGAKIAPGAIVETESAGERSRYFVGPKAGGLEIPFEGMPVCVITPQSPLGSRLMGRRAGDTLPAASGQAPVLIVSVL